MYCAVVGEEHYLDKIKQFKGQLMSGWGFLFVTGRSQDASVMTSQLSPEGSEEGGLVGGHLREELRKQRPRAGASRVCLRKSKKAVWP